jgi:hypothetical protein
MLFYDFWDQSWSVTQIAIALSAISIIYFISIATHRLYFSRYARFPVPKLHLTYGCMFYYDVIAGSGQYYKKIDKLHEEYGEYIGD